MKIIKRNDYLPIIKKEISLDNIVNYNDLNIEKITFLLNKVISENTYSTFDLLKLLKDNYCGNLLDTIEEIKDYSNVRFNCYYASKLLKEELLKIGIDTKVISYKSIGFSSRYGDNLIKEAHMALALPTKKENKLYYIVLDPGLRIPIPLEFPADADKTKIEIDNDVIIIEKNADNEYPYSMEMKGYNRYSTTNQSYCCKEFFDIKYETINHYDVLFPISYKILEGYRLINYPLDKKNWALIKIMIIEQYLECVDIDNKLKISFDELKKMDRKSKTKILKCFTQKLKVDNDTLVDIIEFVLKNNDEFINTVINENVFKEKTLQLKYRI